MDKKRKKVGLALGSGGVRGLAHVGVVRSLEKNNIPIDFIAGSSIGAWIGAHYALFKDVEKLKKDSIGDKRKKLGAFLDPTLRGGIINGNKITNYLKEFFDDKDFADLQIPLKVIATGLIAVDQVIFYEGKIVPAVRASMTFPTIFKPLMIDKMALVDVGSECVKRNVSFAVLFRAGDFGSAESS